MVRKRRRRVLVRGITLFPGLALLLLPGFASVSLLRFPGFVDLALLLLPGFASVSLLRFLGFVGFALTFFSRLASIPLLLIREFACFTGIVFVGVNQQGRSSQHRHRCGDYQQRLDHRGILSPVYEGAPYLALPEPGLNDGDGWTAHRKAMRYLRWNKIRGLRPMRCDACQGSTICLGIGGSAQLQAYKLK